MSAPKPILHPLTGEDTLQNEVSDLAESYRQIALHEQHLQSLALATNSILWRASPTGGAESANKSWERFTGQQAEDHAGDGWINALHPDDRERVRKEWSAAQLRGGVYEVEYRLQRANGGYASMRSHAVAIKDENGIIREWIGSVVNLSELRDAERAAAESSRQRLEAAEAGLMLQDRMAALGQISAVVAHEIRNPLGAIFNALSILKRRVDDPLIQVVSDEADRLDRIVGDLLDFARPARPSLELGSLSAVLDEAIQGVRLKLPEVRFEVRVDPKADALRMDARLIRQLLINLFENAGQAMGGKGKVTVRALPNTQKVILTISDEGPGVPVDLQEKVFEPFFTTKATGTGMGLTVVRTIAESHGGRVRVRSSPEGGSEFQVELFRSEADRGESEEKPS
jgi:PAS domain S-box-containing protein